MLMKKNVFLFFILTISLYACKKKTTDTPLDPYRVKYTIGCSDCTVRFYSDKDGHDTVFYHQNSSWSYSTSGKPGQNLFLWVYNTSQAAETLTATIYLADTVLATASASRDVNGSVFCSDTIK